jgi:hypothetical protein
MSAEVALVAQLHGIRLPVRPASASGAQQIRMNGSINSLPIRPPPLFFGPKNQPNASA